MCKPYSWKLIVGGVSVGLLLLVLVPVSASSANISQSYQLTDVITDGSLVSLVPTRSNYVQLANIDNGQYLLGVAVASNESLLAVNPTAGSVQVATSGTVNVLVSTLGGPIESGDQISVSPFDGMGIKAVPGANIIGLAQTDFNNHSANATSEQVTNKAGQTTRIMVGYIRIGIAIGAGYTGDSNLNSLQRLVQSLTGHAVSTLRIVASVIIAVVALIVLITLVYASIHSSIISIGRNPLAKHAIMHTLASIIGMTTLTAAVTVVIVYLLLR